MKRLSATAIISSAAGRKRMNLWIPLYVILPLFYGLFNFVLKLKGTLSRSDNYLISLDGVPGLKVNRFCNLLHILHNIMEFLFCCSQKVWLRIFIDHGGQEG
jgi:hypothetical protein